METTITPTTGRLLVSKINRKDTATASGILMPSETLQEENLMYGNVVKGESFKEGTTIFYSRYSATKVVDDKGKEFFIISADDVMASEEYDAPKV